MSFSFVSDPAAILKLELNLKSRDTDGMDGLLTVSQVSARSGFAASALRFYEREGLIQAGRSAGGQRRYRREVLRRLAFIRAARNVGLSLDEVRAELGQLPDERTPTTGDWHRISKDWRARLDEKITAIEGLRGRVGSWGRGGGPLLEACSLFKPRG